MRSSVAWIVLCIVVVFFNWRTNHIEAVDVSVQMLVSDYYTLRENPIPDFNRWLFLNSSLRQSLPVFKIHYFSTTLLPQ